jgi:hypothetical protein
MAQRMTLEQFQNLKVGDVVKINEDGTPWFPKNTMFAVEENAADAIVLETMGNERATLSIDYGFDSAHQWWLAFDGPYIESPPISALAYDWLNNHE